MGENRILQILVGVFVLLMWVEIKGSWLMDPDEPRYAEIPREMLATGDYVTPRLNGSHYFEKPPLLYWMNAAAMKVFGETPFAARMCARLAGVGTALLLIFLLPLSNDPLVGWWAALIYLSAPLSFALSRINLTDAPLTFGLTLTLLSMRRFVQAIEHGEKTGKWSLAAGLGAAIAVLSKGPVGIVLSGLIFVLWTIGRKKHAFIWKLVFSRGSLLFFSIASPWFILMEMANPGFTKFFFIHEHILRYATPEAKRGAPFYFFAVTFAWGFFPWLIPFFKSVRAFFSKSSETGFFKSDHSFFIAWFLLIFIFFSISQSKLIPYILPAFPAAAALAADWIVARQDKIQRWWKWQIPIWAGFYLTLILMVPRIAKGHSEHDLALAANRLQADQIVAYHCYPQSFPWVMKHPIPVVNFQGELASDGAKSPELFWDENKFWNRWVSKDHMIVCAPKSDLQAFNKSLEKKPFIVGESRQHYLLTNFNPEGVKSYF